MKAWVIGGGGGGAYDSSGCQGNSDGFDGGESVKTYTVTGGATVSYVIGAAGVKSDLNTSNPTNGGNTTLTYGGVTITATGGSQGVTAPLLAGSGSGGDFNRTFNAGGVLDFQGRLAAITLSGSSLTAGFKGVSTSTSATNGSPGGLVLYFT